VFAAFEVNSSEVITFIEQHVFFNLVSVGYQIAKLDFFIELYKTNRIQLYSLTRFVLFVNGSVLKQKLHACSYRSCGSAYAVKFCQY
jgi:hypothetical protein